MKNTAKTKGKRMDKLEEDQNGLRLCFLKTWYPDNFSKIIFVFKV